MAITQQGIFNKVVKHLIKQGRRAMIASNGNCAYRGLGGTSCAVGCLINDKNYKPDLEGRLISYDPSGPSGVRKAVERSIKRSLTEQEVSMLRDLQRLHDTACGLHGEVQFGAHIAKYSKCIAYDYKLKEAVCK